MLKISKLADYAVMVLGALAEAGEASVSATELAQAARLPQTTAAKVLKLLARSGLVQASRGVSGGYKLPRRAADISVTEIIAAIDGPVKLTDCVGASHSCLHSTCGIRGRWDPVNRALVTALNEVSLADMLARTPLPFEKPVQVVEATQ